MTIIRALIVDDEPLAREGIELRLTRHRDVEIVGSIGRAAVAVTAIQRLKPDLLFLDVQMPGMSGFDVLSKLVGAPPPATVFVTAHDQYAIKAFRSHALDYLLKPIDDSLFDESVARARVQLRSKHNENVESRLRALLNGLAASTAPAAYRSYARRLSVKDRGRVTLVEVADIERIEADGDYVRLCTAAKVHLHRESLGALETQLDPAEFQRVHRSTIVNIGRVREARSHFHGEYVLTMQSGARMKVSRSYKSALGKLLGTSTG